MTSPDRRNEHIQHILDFMEKVYISPKVEDFVNSIREQFEERGKLTDKQYEALLNIYERV